MFEIGELVVYGVHGVCRVTEMREQTVGGKKQKYLVLKPVNSKATEYFVPTGNPAAMAKLFPLATREKLEALLASEEIRTSVWIPDENRRKQVYREMISGGSREKLMQAVFTLYQQKAIQKAAGRRLHMCDEGFLHDAEKRLAEEIENVMELDAPEAIAYLREKLA